MKIRSDFITNSSSTNYIIISKQEASNESLAHLFGFGKDSPLTPHIQDLVHNIISDIKTVEDFLNCKYSRDRYENEEEFIKEKFSNKTYMRFLEAVERKEHVYIGSFSSDEPEFLCFFCTDPILIEGDDIYYDGIESGW